MRVTICAIGRLRADPELDLINDYLQRFDRTGRNLGLGPAQIIELEDKKGGGQAAEAVLLERAIPKGATICAMDERGKVMSSPDFANMLGGWRDQGVSDLAFVIGGADGLTKDLRAQADTSLSFGKMVWPHMLARVMLSEQLYRAASILSGSPYHRV
ncbi:23S rRNA (pseudouridine1915-N3)-methyltransferase [Litoreibacter halocynthiae]|uniref:Ribosomal RNA large subunit methyltransferase H n=1 Tax=Litoreibacter halocynthiae TaxID=1242689 RepID=A0A4R7LH66_9RHOB|nr:23S rRNA (pseudouridine(1915)-N(3))-methyltransferase RlmH [Litoreibacter halocynthiae]TDT73661.1 23S rRNA (pseudouridine1915-N3)-methyltransferase [Litoreibacter halocynthiae]